MGSHSIQKGILCIFPDYYYDWNLHITVCIMQTLSMTKWEYDIPMWVFGQCGKVYLLIWHSTCARINVSTDLVTYFWNVSLLLIILARGWCMESCTDEVLRIVSGSQLTVQNRSSSDICCGYLTWPVVCASTIWAVGHLECGKGA